MCLGGGVDFNGFKILPCIFKISSLDGSCKERKAGCKFFKINKQIIICLLVLEAGDRSGMALTHILLVSAQTYQAGLCWK